MMFALILESSRLSSPTTVVYESMILPSSHSPDFESLVLQKGITTVGDYAFGGLVAGLAGALARRPPPEASTGNRLQLPVSITQSGRRPLVLWSVGVGFGLGFVAGVFQAAVDMGDLYIERGKAEQVLEKK